MGAEILEGTNGNKPGFLTSQGALVAREAR